MAVTLTASIYYNVDIFLAAISVSCAQDKIGPFSFVIVLGHSAL